MIKLEQIRICLEGWVPSTLATCDGNGVPNISYVSQVHYVDAQHVALTFQFFNKTHKNILANPQATLLMIDPLTGAKYRLALVFRRTEVSGPLFEGMKAKLAGIANSSGMQDVFKLLGADIYQVMDIELVPDSTMLPPPIPKNTLFSLREVFTKLGGISDLAELFAQTLQLLTRYFMVEHAILLLADNAGQKLYTVETLGYSNSGIGSEIPFGYGVIGTAAQQQTPIRITHMATEYTYVQAMRAYLQQHENTQSLETSIAFPGLAQPHSQMAVPICDDRKLLGVLYVESPQDYYFSFDEEDALVSLALLLGQLLLKLQPADHEASEVEASLPAADEPVSVAALSGSDNPAVIRYFSENQSIFVDQEYLIKGVAGAIFWRLLQLWQSEGRYLFSNRELRLDKLLKLPDIDDNLEARLILLRRRLAERCNFIAIEKAGRGSFRLAIDKPLSLIRVEH
ncbi:MAG TPA: GAF domain-containing protein [Cellvibrio sp.]|nr:GAF domain-containing protein [Cellvibrio sp.]